MFYTKEQYIRNKELTKKANALLRKIKQKEKRDKIKENAKSSI